MELKRTSAVAVHGRTPRIHPFAVVDPGATIGADVDIGPFAAIGDDVVIGDGCRIMSHAAVLPGVRLGADCAIHAGAILGGEPQNLRYRGERTYLEIGNRTVVREYVTVSRATTEGHATRVGPDCMLMAGSHVGHDCILGRGVVLANGVQLAGHCEVGDGVVIGGLAAVHQYVRIGRLAMIGGSSGLTQDAPPFMITAGAVPAVVYGPNHVGLRRAGVSAAVRADLKAAYRLLYRRDLNVSQAVQRIREALELSREVLELVEFIATAHRGLCAGVQQRRRRLERQSRGGHDHGR